MKHKPVLLRTLSLFLILALTLPVPGRAEPVEAHALRAAGLEENRFKQPFLNQIQSAAGVEEIPEIKIEILDRLDKLQSQLQKQRKEPFVWSDIVGRPLMSDPGRSNDPLEDRIYRGLSYVMAMLLDRPNPSRDEDFKTVLGIIDQEILGPVSRTTFGDWNNSSMSMGNFYSLVQALPTAEDCLIVPLSYLYGRGKQFALHQDALSVYSRRASALAFGRSGPHQRSGGLFQVDGADVQTAPLLLRGFVSHLDRMLGQVEET